jgi:predicted GNAT family N-acyltransferase
MVENKIEIREIIYNSEAYRNELELRDKVLRQPLGISLYDESLEADRNDYHIGAYLNDRVVGVMILTRLNTDEVKMRQVAVDENLRNKKTGSKMVLYAEQYAISMGYSTVVLHARETAVVFYEKLGYEKSGKVFLEINIPHYKMCKRLHS